MIFGLSDVLSFVADGRLNGMCRGGLGDRGLEVLGCLMEIGDEVFRRLFVFLACLDTYVRSTLTLRVER